MTTPLTRAEWLFQRFREQGVPDYTALVAVNALVASNPEKDWTIRKSYAKWEEAMGDGPREDHRA